MLHLIKAEEKDLSTIAGLAHVIWNEHYVPIIGKKQVDYMLKKMYDLESLKQQLNEKQHIFYLINSEGKAIGFLSVENLRNGDFFLHKFYIDQQKSNQGIGTAVLNLLIDKINPKTLKLTVNRQNFKSINFYFKNGFKILSIEDFDIGNNYLMNDFVMVRSL